MPAERRYASNAERQKAYRERARQERLARAAASPDNAELVAAIEEATGEPLVPSVERVADALEVFDAVLSEPLVKSSVVVVADLERYVADAVFMAELHHSQTSPNATMSTKTLADQIERAESYARWRYAGVLSGEVLGL